MFPGTGDLLAYYPTQYSKEKNWKMNLDFRILAQNSDHLSDSWNHVTVTYGLLLDTVK